VCAAPRRETGHNVLMGRAVCNRRSVAALRSLSA
jgi:hypothetical protein